MISLSVQGQFVRRGLEMWTEGNSRRRHQTIYVNPKLIAINAGTNETTSKITWCFCSSCCFCLFGYELLIRVILLCKSFEPLVCGSLGRKSRTDCSIVLFLFRYAFGESDIVFVINVIAEKLVTYGFFRFFFFF